MITIVGAGMAGLLAARLLGNRGHKVKVLETQESLPNNHTALLRFRTSAVADVTGIDFRKVEMIKATLPGLNSVANALHYSFKANGEYRSDRSIPHEVVRAERWIAPDDFIARLAEGADIQYDVNFKIDYKTAGPIISTMPMPTLWNVFRNASTLEKPTFSSREGWTLKARIAQCEAYATLYVPNPAYPFHRVSITGDQLIVELSGEGHNPLNNEMIAYTAAYLMGLKPREEGDDHTLFDIEVHQQKYAKIIPIDERQRKMFMAFATDNYNIFSLGRFATWRPGLLLDDLVKDVLLIEKWIKDGSNYNMKGKR